VARGPVFRARGQNWDILWVSGSLESLPTLNKILGLPNRDVTPLEEGDLGLAGLF